MADVAASPTLADLRRRTGGLALEAFARAVAAAPASWGEVALPDGEERTYTRVYADEEVEAWILCWELGQGTGVHDHDGSAGAVHVVQGAVVEEVVVGVSAGALELRSTTIVAGEGFSFDGRRVHRVAHAGTGLAVTVHVYSPPIARMGYYEVAPDGSLVREVVDHRE